MLNLFQLTRVTKTLQLRHQRIEEFVQTSGRIYDWVNSNLLARHTTQLQQRLKMELKIERINKEQVPAKHDIERPIIEG